MGRTFTRTLVFNSTGVNVRAYDGDMLQLPGSVVRPATLTLLTLLALVPAGYLYGHAVFQSKAATVKWERRTETEQKVANLFHKWLYDEIDYSRGFKNRIVNGTVDFANSKIRDQFETELWPQNLRSNSSGIFASPIFTDAVRKGRNIWKVSSTVSFTTVHGNEGYLQDTIIFDIDLSARPPKILRYKHEYPEIDVGEFLANSKISEHSKYSSRSVSLFKKAAYENFSNHYQTAVDDLSKALLIEPTFKNAAILRAQIAALRLKPEMGERILTETINLLPDRWSLYRARASLRLDQGNYAGALEDLNLSIKYEPEIAASYLNRGYCLSQFKKHKEALADMDLVIKLEPKYKFFHFHRALEREASGDVVGAFWDFTEVRLNCPGEFFDENNQRQSVVPYVMFLP